MTREEIRKFVDLAVGTRPEAIYEILEEAAEAATVTGIHVDENWGDRKYANAWRRIAKLINAAAARVKKAMPFTVREGQ